MQSEVTGVVKDVQGKSTKKGTVYEIKFEGGQTVATFKAPLAEKANGLKGQNVRVQVTAQQKGDYTNYYLEEIVGTGAPAAMPSINNGLVADGLIAAAAAPIPTKTDDAAPRIARSVAFEHLPLYYENDLIEMSSDLEAVLSKFATWIYTGGWTGGNEAEVISILEGMGATPVDGDVQTW